MGEEECVMRVGLIVCLAGCLLAAPAEKKAQKPAETTMTGCVDQRGDNFVLTGDEQLKAIAVLHGDGFPDENFARHMGHKVTVQGTLSSEGEQQVMKVLKITHVSDSCSPE
jgi:hypothetical protein